MPRVPLANLTMATLIAAFTSSCSAPAASSLPSAASSAPSQSESSHIEPAPPLSSSTAAVSGSSTKPPFAHLTDAPPKPPPSVTPKRALEVLFLEDEPETARRCLESDSNSDAIECMLKVRYAKDEVAQADALSLYRVAGWVAGLEHAREMDGGWRGLLQLVPELPVRQHRRHLKWMKHSANEMSRFFAAHAKHSKSKPKYRWQALQLKFFRSVGRTTPSAYAKSWSIAYNVSGSLHKSGNSVSETMFHEVFHLNDDGWSVRKLKPIYDDIVRRCTKNGKLSTPCLTPFAPHHTMVRGGTYYAFQPGNGVWEYAAELALRYNREHRARWFGGKAISPFKCGPKQNAAAWQELVQDMFAGVDDTPACPK